MFKDRYEAGKKLAELLEKYRGSENIVYALPRGGVLCGTEVASKLLAPFDLICIRKIAHPEIPEYAIGAVAADGSKILSSEVKNFSKRWLRNTISKAKKEAQNREAMYLGERKHMSSIGRNAIIVDDGIATGFTIRLAIAQVKKDNPQKIIVAVPVAPPDVANQIQKEVDELIIAEKSDVFFGSVSMYYESFPQISDEEVIEIMKDYF